LEVSIVFPHQLFKHNPCLEKNRKIIVVEEYLFFKQYPFHKQKIVLHRASMQFYKQYLLQNGYHVDYIESVNENSNITSLVQYLHSQECTRIFYIDVVDNWLQRKLEKASNNFGITLIKLHSPNFINTMDGVHEFFKDRKTYFQTDFYIWQRKQRNILVDANKKPIGGKWTFDTENRNKFSAKEKIPAYPFPTHNSFVDEAIVYANTNFANNIGTCSSLFNSSVIFYPTTFEEAEKWLQHFLKERFQLFGLYEDAIVANENILYHSVLTPMLNIGLLHPQQIIDAALQVADANNIPLNSLEGFIRQIIGWREFIRIVYEKEGVKQRTTNYWGFTRKIPESFYTGTTGIVPIDITIKKLLQNGYNHHIERLMILGNFMLLCEFEPNEVYKWFMEMYVDAYDWVMVPNVYGMTQFADGGLMTTKPYISGSNYIMKMSNFEKGKWQEIWDGLFWHFMNKQRHFFLQNPRLGMLVGTFDKMSDSKKDLHLHNATKFLQSLEKC
jgi:deoxyribodipyrimidine photolyase-related protein